MNGLQTTLLLRGRKDIKGVVLTERIEKYYET